MESRNNSKMSFKESFKESKESFVESFKKGWAVFKDKFGDANGEATARRTTDLPFFEPPTMNQEERKDAFSKKRIEMTADEIFESIDGD